MVAFFVACGLLATGVAASSLSRPHAKLLATSTPSALLPNAPSALPPHNRLRGGGSSVAKDKIKDQLRTDLEAMDTDKSGTITIDEYVAYQKREFERTRRLESHSMEMSDRQWRRLEENTRRRCGRLAHLVPSRARA